MTLVHIFGVQTFSFGRLRTPRDISKFDAIFYFTQQIRYTIELKTCRNEKRWQDFRAVASLVKLKMV